MPPGSTAACSSRSRRRGADASGWAAVRDGLLMVRAQIEDLVDKVNRLSGTHTRGRGRRP
jgi:hypothetical protein